MVAQYCAWFALKRDSAAWRRLRAQVLAEERTCWLCGHEIDFDAPPRSRYSPSVDHIIPMAKGGDSTREQLRAAHYGCNAAKKDRLTIRKAKTSRLL
jgi:5-methylcytosine-specific restriction endonuclease McrA